MEHHPQKKGIKIFRIYDALKKIGHFFKKITPRKGIERLCVQNTKTICLEFFKAFRSGMCCKYLLPRQHWFHFSLKHTKLV